MTTSPYTRHTTRHRGVSYRERSNGTRTYYVYAAGKHNKVEGAEREALLLQADLRTRQARGENLYARRMTFGQLAEEWYDAKKSRTRHSTWSGYRIALDKYVLPTFGHLPATSVTPDRIASLIREMESRGLGGSYIDNTLKPLRGTMKLAVRRGLVTSNPVDALLPEERPRIIKRRRRVWTPADINGLLGAAEALGARSGNVYDYTPFLTVAIYTGMRPSEILGLRWSDIDFSASVIHVRHQLSRQRELEPPKTDAGVREIPIPESLTRFLKRLRLSSKFSQNEHFVFSSKLGTPLEHHNVAKRGFAAAAERAGLNRPGEPNLTLYDLRHAFASVVAHHGLAAVDLAVFMGHEDARVTEQTYIHPFDRPATAARFRAAVDAAMMTQTVPRN